MRYDEEAPRLTADFEVVTPRLPVAPERVEGLGHELAKYGGSIRIQGRH